MLLLIQLTYLDINSVFSLIYTKDSTSTEERYPVTFPAGKGAQVLSFQFQCGCLTRSNTKFFRERPKLLRELQ